MTYQLPKFAIIYGAGDAEVRRHTDLIAKACRQLSATLAPELVKSIEICAVHNPGLMAKFAYYQSLHNCAAIANLAPLAQATTTIKN